MVFAVRAPVGVYSAFTRAVKEIKLLDITFAAGVEKLDKDEREVRIKIITFCEK